MSYKNRCLVKVGLSTVLKEDLIVRLYEYDRFLMAIRQHRRRVKNFGRPWEARIAAAQNKLLLRLDHEI